MTLTAMARLQRTSDGRIHGEVVIRDSRGRTLLLPRTFEATHASEAQLIAHRLGRELLIEYKMLHSVCKQIVTEQQELCR